MAMTDTPPARDARPSPALAIFSAKLAWSDIPERVRHEAKRFLVNYFACAIAGSGQPAITRQLRLLPQLSGPPTSRIIGQSPKTDMLWASYLNAGSANLFDFDDTHFPTILHPTAPVAPVLFALAETRPGSMSGKMKYPPFPPPLIRIWFLVLTIFSASKTHFRACSFSSSYHTFL